VSTLLACDFGIRHTAYAVFLDRRLNSAGLVKSPNQKPVPEPLDDWLAMARAVTDFLSLGTFGEVVIERFQVYPHSKGDPNDLLTLSGVAGAVVGHYRGSKVTSYLPRQWKGQVPKHVTESRVTRALAVEEKASVTWPAKSLCHNVYDAIGIGLHHLGRY
jgi:hypothetical protein